MKLDQQNVGKPSRVIHIRNIPNDVSEAEIVHLGIPFGRVTNVLVLKGKNQAFLEMGEESSATTMVNYFATSMAQLRGRAVYVQYSNHKELKTDQTHSNAVSPFCPLPGAVVDALSDIVKNTTTAASRRTQLAACFRSSGQFSADY